LLKVAGRLLTVKLHQGLKNSNQFSLFQVDLASSSHNVKFLEILSKVGFITAERTFHPRRIDFENDVTIRKELRAIGFAESRSAGFGCARHRSFAFDRISDIHHQA